MVQRNQDEIIKDLRRVECGLSPENLSADGERSRAETNRRRVRLNKERRELVKELGREPTYQELWGR